MEKRLDSWPTLWVCVPRGMGNWDYQEHSCSIPRGEIFGFVSKRTIAKAFPTDVFIDHERRSSKTIKSFYHEPCRLEIGVVSSMIPSAPFEISKGLVS